MARKKTISRRNFLKVSRLGAASALGFQSKVLSKPVESKSGGDGAKKWGMVIDQAKCTGCGYCTLACQAHNDSPPQIQWNRVIKLEPVGEREVFLARPCLHCGHAPCVSVCPVKATYYRSDGLVMMDYDRCIGCRYCEVACPFGARAFNWDKFDGDNPAVPDWGKPEIERRPRGVVEKCSFCFHRIDRGFSLGLTPGIDADATPACVVACPVRARVFGDLNDSHSEVNKLLDNHPHFRLREDLGTDPHVYYLPAQGESVGG